MQQVSNAQSPTLYLNYCCMACAGCCVDPIKISKQLGQVLVSSDGYIEPRGLFRVLTPMQKQIFIRLAINSPRPVERERLFISDNSGLYSLKTQITRMRKITREYELDIVSYAGFGYAMEQV